MQEVNLKILLLNYTANLCDKQFIFTLPKGKKIKVVFFRESLCHLMGLQYVYDRNSNFLGAKGYKKIEEESITFASLKSHNKKQYGFIKERLRHFDKIIEVLRQGKIIRFDEKQVARGTYIVADFMIFNEKEDFILHLFLRKEQNTDIYAPVSFVVHSKNDINAYKFLEGQKVMNIVDRTEISQLIE